MSTRAAHLLCVLALAWAGAAHAQSSVSASSPPPLVADLDRRTAADPQAEGARNLALAMMGREDRIRREMLPRCVLAEADPLDMIETAARNTNIVIINEASDIPRHRAFIADVAARLIPLGYRTYAAETLLAPTASGPGAPKLRHGYASQEPAFGQLLRQLRAADIHLVAYDQAMPTTGDFADDINRRVAQQASNLVNRIFLSDRQEKVLIHVSWGHNKETPEGVGRGMIKARQILWLGQRLKEILGVDPLTIDQTTYAAERDGACFTETSGAAPPLSRDLHIAHPPDTFENDRPTWRIERGQTPVPLPRALRRADARVIAEARPDGEDNDTVPVDRVLVEPGEDIPLLLEPGRYTLRAWIDDQWTADVKLTVPRKARSGR